MAKRTVVLVVILLLALPAFAGIGAQGATTNWDVDTNDISVTFEPGDGDSLTRDVTVSNNDPNETVNISASIDYGHEVDPSLTLGPGESGTLEVTLYPGGPSDATLTISGGGVSETIPVSVETPAYIEISDVPEWMDDDGVLKGESRSAEITVEEVGGYSGFDGVEVESSGNVNFYDLEQTSLSAGGSTTVDVTFSAPNDADQHEDLGGRYSFDPQFDGSDETSATYLETWVAYPPTFDDIELTDTTFTFDQPREVGQLTKETEISVENTGDRELVFDSISLSSPSFQQVSVASNPATIPRQSSRTVQITVVASTELDQGRHPISGTMTAESASVNDANFEDDMRVSHEIGMNVSTDQVDIGDIAIGESGEGGLNVEETLGYRTISTVELNQTEGPEQWISVSQGPPSTIGAGSSNRVSYEIAFDTEAEIGTTYQWTYVIDGEDVSPKEVTVSATPIPLNLDETKQRLQEQVDGDDSTARIAEGSLGLVEDLDEKTRDGSVDRADISPVLTYSDGVIRFIETVNSAQASLEADEHGEAQAPIIQAAVAYNTMSTYSEAIDNDELRGQTVRIQEEANSQLSAVIDEQRSYYEERLQSEETSLLQKAAIKRELALITTLQGDEERAATLNEEADAAFEEYSAAVETGEQKRLEATATWSEMKSEQFTMLFGQPALLNPTHYEDFEAKSDSMLEAYDEAEAAYRDAGETSEADAVADERSTRVQELTIARYTLYGSIGMTILIAVGLVVWTGRGMYWYLKDSREAVSGDFLV